LANAIGDPRVVPFDRGASWWATGWRILAADFWTWIGIMIIYLVLSIALMLVPIVGGAGHWLLTPVFMGGLMTACRAAARHEPVRVAHLFAGFQGEPFVPLLIIGAVNIALTFGIGFIVAAGVIGGMHFLDLSKLGSMDDISAPLDALAETAGAIGLTGLLATLAALVIASVFTMLNWFAPALVILQGAAAVDAMKKSFASCWRNWLPFLFYGLIAVGALLALFMLCTFLAIAFGASAYLGGKAAGWGAVFVLVALFGAIMAVVALVIGPVTLGSIYGGYADTLAADAADTRAPPA
jgi:uncharacterized membrane protein